MRNEPACRLVAITTATWPSCAAALERADKNAYPCRVDGNNPREIDHKPVVSRVYHFNDELPQPGRGIYVDFADRPDERDVFRRIFVLKAQIHAPSITFFSLPG